VAGVGLLSAAGVGPTPAEGTGSVAPAIGDGSGSVGGVGSISSSMIGLELPVSAGTGQLEAECVATGAWVSLALPIPRSDLTSFSSWLYMGIGQYQE